MKLENYLPILEEKFGKILHTSEEMSGTYYIGTDPSQCSSHEFYAVLDTAPIAAKVQNYGEKMDGLRLFAWDDPTSGRYIVKYEISKYHISAGERYLSEWLFRDMSLLAMELHPEYFGTLPVPFHTPHGYTLLYRTLANGIYWLETSECKELLAICPPIWELELTFRSRTFGEQAERDWIPGNIGCLFFSKESSCLPIYELMKTHKEWDGTVIDRPALINAIGAFQLVYQMHLKGRKERSEEMDSVFEKLLKETGMETNMSPDAGTDFLLLK